MSPAPLAPPHRRDWITAVQLALVAVALAAAWAGLIWLVFS